MTKDSIRTRMAVVNEESFAAPAQRTKIPPKDPYQWTGFSLGGVEPESSAVANEIIEAFNKANGSNAKPSLTAFPFLGEEQQQQMLKQADEAYAAFMKRRE